jgi:hypothetical protein
MEIFIIVVLALALVTVAMGVKFAKLTRTSRL